MRLVIINGSIQKQNGSSKTAEAAHQAARKAGIDSEVISIAPFDELFRGDYINFTNALSEQKSVMQKMADSPALLFIVPTYFKSIPGALKNFFDIVREKSLYEHKVVGFIASNHKNQDFGARHAELIIQGIAEFFETQLVFIPEITIINPASVDPIIAERTILALQELTNSYQPTT